MLLNRAHGFNSERKRPSIRLVGTYDLAFGGGTSDTITVPDADLSPGSTERQILVVAAIETVIIREVTINGVDAGQLALAGGSGGFIDGWFADYSGDGPFDIVLSTSSASSDDSAIMVFEVDNGDLAAATTIGATSSGGTTVTNASLRAPRDAALLGVVTALTDTVSLSWSSFSEVVDTDAGGQRLGAATGPTISAIPGTDIAETVTASGTSTLALLIIAIPPPGALAFRWLQNELPTAAGTTYQVVPSLQLHGMGTVKLVMLTEVEADSLPLGASYAGVAFSLLAEALNTGASPDLSCRILALDVDTAATPEGEVLVTGLSLLIPFSYSLFVLKNCRTGDAQTVTGNATGAALAVDVENNGIILANHARATDTQTVTWTGVTEIRDQDAGPYRRSQAFANFLAAEQNRTVQAVGSASGQYATAAVSFNP